MVLSENVQPRYSPCLQAIIPPDSGKMCRIPTLKLPTFACEEVQPLSLNLMPTVVFSEPSMLSYTLFYHPRRSLCPTRCRTKQQFPPVSRSSSKAARFTRKVSRSKVTLSAKPCFTQFDSVAVAATPAPGERQGCENGWL